MALSPDGDGWLGKIPEIAMQIKDYVIIVEVLKLKLDSKFEASLNYLPEKIEYEVYKLNKQLKDLDVDTSLFSFLKREEDQPQTAYTAYTDLLDAIRNVLPHVSVTEKDYVTALKESANRIRKIKKNK
jgi:hypothetical protein